MSIPIPLIEPPDTEGLKLEEINRNKDGNYYVIFKLPQVPRGLHGKSKGHVDEVLIIGVPKNKIDGFLRSHYQGKGVSK